MANNKDIFEGVDEPSSVRRLRAAGIHRAVEYKGVQYLAPETKKGEKGKADKELSARALFTFSLLHEIKDPQGKVLSSQALLFEEMRFCPATRPDDVQYMDDKYNKNVIVGKNSPEEQMKIDWERFGMFLFQLGVAISKSQFAAVKTRMSKYAKDMSIDTFKALVEGFEKEFPVAKYGKNLIDMKTVWNNSKDKQSSYLRIAKASGNNIVFAPYEVNAKESSLFINEYERKNLKPLYTGIDNPPTGKEEIIDAADKDGLTAGLNGGDGLIDKESKEGTGSQELDDTTDLF